jgi:hypothetical protein
MATLTERPGTCSSCIVGEPHRRCVRRADATTPAKRLRVRGGYAATPQRYVRATPGALDQAMVGLQAAERAITELQAVVAVSSLVSTTVACSGRTGGDVVLEVPHSSGSLSCS